MAEVQDLIYNVTGQSFIFDAPYRPSSVTSMEVFPWDYGDDATAETATTGSSSISSVNTTFDANSGVSSTNSKTCNLTATTNIVIGGERYLVTNAANESEWVEVVGITSGASVQARSPLHNDYVSGDGFQGTRITISVLAAWIQNVNKISDGTDPNPGWRVKWVWVGTPPGGSATTNVSYTYVDVVRTAGGEYGITAADMERFCPQWGSNLPPNHRDDGGAALVEEGERDFKARLFAAGIPDQQLRNNEAAGQAIKYAARYILQRYRYENGGPADIYERAYDEYIALLNQLFTVKSRVSTGTGTTGAGARTKAPGLWSR